MSASPATIPASASVDFAAVKARQQGAWASGDYSVVGTTLQIVGEALCEAVDLRAGQKVLDVAAGNGNASLAAARRWCEVLATDYVPSLLIAFICTCASAKNRRTPCLSEMTWVARISLEPQPAPAK